MKTSSRPRELGGSFASRRGHGGQLSISDTNHHVTEAIGDMYGDDDFDSKRDSRPLSFLNSTIHESNDESNSYFDNAKGSRARPPVSPNSVNGTKAKSSPALMSGQRSGSFDDQSGPPSPSLSLRDRNPSDTANHQFPLNDIDYESNPAAVAQELSNLQALRRMSMDVGNTSDPDLPSFQGVSLVPSVAPPTGDEDEDDPSRLFWVPAKVHPELAPMEFKKFLENRVQTIKRRSGEQTALSPEGIERSGSGTGLRRKKSMLSRQIDNSGGRGAVGYKDGAEQIERKKSLSSKHAPDIKIADLQELETLVRDPSKAMQKLTLDTGRQSPTDEPGIGEDMPILPSAPGIGLRRSTRTTYRRGSLRKGERVPFSKRAGSIRAEAETEESPTSASPLEGSPGFGYPLTKVQSEPSSSLDNFSRPSRAGRRGQNMQQIEPISTSSESMLDDVLGQSTEELVARATRDTPDRAPQISPPSRSNTFPKSNPVPQIIETPPQPEDTSDAKLKAQFPERSSSQTPPQPKASTVEPPVRSNRRPTLDRQTSSNTQPVPRVQNQNASQTLNDMAQKPSPLLGNNGRTDSLTFIPTLDEKEKKPEKKLKKDRDDENSGSRKTSWGWFKGSDEKDKKSKKKEEDLKGKKAAVDKSHDNARLDVLQSSIETGSSRGRQSLLLDRDSIDNKPQDEKKKDTGRKSSETKKEKDGLFSSFFGGGKKKAERDSGGKKGSSLRTISPDPPHRQLKPDIDYNWTRFSILEERAIYRMAHIKLANPRRALYSQVLLSNFMYSYLAKVQQMHPHMQVPQSAQQKKAEAERKQKEQEQQYREQQQQQQRQEGGEQYRYDYHQGITQYAEPSSQKSDGVDYVDDSQIYDHDHQNEDYSQGQGSHRPQSRQAHNSENDGYGDQNEPHGRQGKDYYSYGGQRDDDDDDDEMW
ncbi:telomere silencing protein [Phlyctema vagabunda]|uniref:Telomere silencing protein n=1 Tax=Phlyctema vagabunda TaxID=108571 RepID=A0ABR4PF72_9HELO